MTDTYRTLGNPVDEKTAGLNLPLPSLLNDQRDDVPRMRQALILIDAANEAVNTALAQKASNEQLATQLAALSDAIDTALALKASVTSVQSLSTSTDAALQALGDDIDAVADALAVSTARSTATTITYTAGRVTAVTQTVQGQGQATAITYDAAGRVASIAYPVDGNKTRTETYTYNAAGDYTGMTAAEVPL